MTAFVIGSNRMECLFCKIVAKEIPAKIHYEDDDIVAFHDIAAQAPIHLLIIPKQHIASLNDVYDENQALLGKLLLTSKRLAIELNIAEAGYRLVNNCRDHGGQTVHHLHFHLLGGRPMSWPPG